MHQLDITTNLQELDRREGDGITVSLLWSRFDDSVSVAVWFEFAISVGPAVTVQFDLAVSVGLGLGNPVQFDIAVGSS